MILHPALDVGSVVYAIGDFFFINCGFEALHSIFEKILLQKNSKTYLYFYNNNFITKIWLRTVHVSVILSLSNGILERLGV